MMTREEARQKIQNDLKLHHDYLSGDYRKALRMAIEALQQPEIIRCKDCKHSEHWYRDKSRCFLWHEEGIDVFEDGFCNYAERRTDEKNT